MRVFHNGSLEITNQVSRFDANSYSFALDSADYIYIASDFPLNHFYIALSQLNTTSATLKVEYMGSGWNESVNTIDGTNALFNSGFIEFTPNKNAGWSRQDSDQVPGMSLVVYSQYWLRISSDTTLDNTEIDFMGNKFSDDTDLYSEFPIFNDTNFLSCFGAGKTSWEEQHIKAAHIIISDLIKKKVVVGPEQILTKDKFLTASVCKVAEIIYNAFGNDYIEQKKQVMIEYPKRLDLSQYNVDTNNNAIKDPVDVQEKQGWISR